MRPTKEKMSKFDLDLKYGQIREDKIAEMFTDIFCTLIFDVPKLKKLIEKLDFKKSVSGGDHNASRMWLVNVRKLFTSDVYKTFEDLNDE
jgi:hypothetical protein